MIDHKICGVCGDYTKKHFRICNCIGPSKTASSKPIRGAKPGQVLTYIYSCVDVLSNKANMKLFTDNDSQTSRKTPTKAYENIFKNMVAEVTKTIYRDQSKKCIFSKVNG
jgi:hypothetical protein